VNVGTLFIQISADASGVARGLSKAEQAMERFGSRMFFMGSRITAGVTVPIAGAVAAIGKIGLEFDKAMTESLAIMTDKSRGMRDQMEKEARRIAQTSTFSAAEIAKGYYDLASAGFEAEDAIQSIGTVANFAQAGLIDMSRAGDILASAVHSMGVEFWGTKTKAQAMVHTADVLTKANNMALGSVEQFAKALTTRAGQAGKIFSKDIEEVVAGLAVFQGQAQYAQKAGQQFWMTMRDLQAAQIKAPAAWIKSGISVFAGEGEMRPLGDILEQLEMKFKGFSNEQIRRKMELGATFEELGDPAGKAMNAAEKARLFASLRLQDRSRAAIQMLVDYSKEYRTLVRELYDAAGETERVRVHQMEALSKQFLMVRRRLEELALKIFDRLEPWISGTLIPWLFNVVAALDRMLDKFMELPPWIQKTALGLLAIVAASGPVVFAVGSWTLFFSAMLGGFSAVAGSAAKLITLLLRLVGLAPAAAAAAGVGSGAGAAAGSMTAGAVGAALGKPRVTGLTWQGGKLTAVPGVTTVSRGVVGAAVGAGVTGAAVGTGTGLAGNAGSVGTLAKAWQGLAEALSHASGILRTMLPLFARLTGAFTVLLPFIEYGLHRGFRALWDVLVGMLPPLILVEKAFARLWRVISAQLPTWEEFKVITAEAAAGAWQFAKDTYLNLQDFFLRFFDLIAEHGRKIRTMVDEFPDWVRGKWDEGLDYIGVSPMLAIVSGKFEELGNWIKAMPMYQWMATALEGAAQAVTDWLGWAQGAIGNSWLGNITFTKPGEGIANWFSNSFMGGKGWNEYAEGIRYERAAPERAAAAQKKFDQSLKHAPWKTGNTFWDDPITLADTLGAVSVKNASMLGRLTDRMNPLPAAFNPRATTKPLPAHFFFDLVPTPKDDAGTGNAKAERERQLLDQLMGGGTREWQEMVNLWGKHEKALLANEYAMDRYFEAYQKVYDLIDTSKLPAKLREEMEARRIEAQFIARNTDAYAQLLGTMQTGPATGELERMATELSNRIRTDYGNEVPANIPYAFFEKHAEELENISKGLVKIPDNLRPIVHQYRQWKDTAKFLDQHGAGLEHVVEMYSAVADSAAKTKDMESELVAFRMNEADRTLKGLRKGEEERTRDSQKEFARRAQFFSSKEALTWTQADRDQYAKGLIEWRRVEEDRLATATRLDLERAASAAGVNKLIVRSFENMSNDALRELIKLKMGSVTIFTEVFDQLSQAFENLASAFGHGVDSTLSFLSRAFGLMGKALNVRKDLQVGLTSIGAGLKSGDWGAVGAGAMGMFASASQGVALMAEATDQRNAWHRAMGGAMAGSQLGLGVAVGALIGMLRRPAWAKAFKEVGRDWGVSVTEELAKKISEDAKTLFKGDRVTASLFNIGAIIQEAGGLKDTNIGMFMRKYHDVFSAIETGHMTAVQGMEIFTDQFGQFSQYWIDEGADLATAMDRHMSSMFRLVTTGALTAKQVHRFLEKNFEQFAQSFLDSEQVASGAFVRLIDNYKKLGIESKKITKFLIEQGQKAGSAWDIMLQHYEALLGERDEESGKFLDAKHWDGAEQTLQRIGTLLMATFNSMVSANVPWLTALDAITTGVDRLAGLYEALGLEVDNVAVKELMRYRQIMKANEGLFIAVDALSQGTIALSSLGGMSQDTFDALQQQGVAMFSEMQAAVEAFGGTQADALRPFAGWLDGMRRMADQYGLTLDDNTMALINQAIEMGVLKDDARDLIDVLIDGFVQVEKVLTRIADVLDNIAVKMGAIPAPTGSPGGGGGGGGHAGDGGVWDVPDLPGVPGAARGVYATRPVVRVFGEGGEPELGGPVGFMSRALAGALAETGANQGGTRQPIQIVLRDRVVGEAIIDIVPSILRQRGLR
jgi:TP901 family phage tail tape measure protein